MENVNLLTMGIYDKATTYTHCTVEVWENSLTGECSVGWYRSSETEVITDGQEFLEEE